MMGWSTHDLNTKVFKGLKQQFLDIWSANRVWTEMSVAYVGSTRYLGGFEQTSGVLAVLPRVCFSRPPRVECIPLYTIQTRISTTIQAQASERRGRRGRSPPQCWNHGGESIFSPPQNSPTFVHAAGADLGFYKGGCPIHLKGTPPPSIILTHATGTKQFVGLRRNSWRQAVVRHLELCQIPY